MCVISSINIFVGMVFITEDEKHHWLGVSFTIPSLYVATLTVYLFVLMYIYI